MKSYAKRRPIGERLGKILITASALILLTSFNAQSQILKFTDAEKSVVQISILKPDGSFTALGTGFFIREDGLIATVFHIYGDAAQAISQLRGGTIGVWRAKRDSNRYVFQPIQLLNFDTAHDLALFKLTGKIDSSLWNTVGGIKALKLSDAIEISPNTNVIAVGYFGTDQFPLILSGKLVGETVFTIVPSTSSPVTVPEFLASLGATPGESGSPVMLDDGSVIGVVDSIVTATAPFSKEPFATGLNRIVKVEFLQKLMASVPAT